MARQIGSQKLADPEERDNLGKQGLTLWGDFDTR